MDKVVFIGAGNMAEALVKSLPQDSVRVTDIRPERLDYMRDTYGVEVASENASSVGDAEVIVLAVKPQQMKQVLEELSGSIPGSSTLLSIAAGIRLSFIEQALGGQPRVIRSMPNSPSLIGEGIAAICAGAHAGEEDLQRAREVLEGAGQVVEVPEEAIDAVTAVSGSGPAYVFRLMEAMTEAARKLGLEDDTAHRLVYATVKGAALLADASDASPATLREQVTSKGGTTEAALNVMNESGVYEGLVKAILAAENRSKELST